MLTELEKLAPPTRRVLIAVELVDPVTRERLRRGIAPKLRDGNDREMAAKPIVNHSGRFVYQETAGIGWPAKIEVLPGKLPFEPMTVAVAPLPDPVTPNDRLVPIMLRPTLAYPFGEGATTVRGRIWEKRDEERIGVQGAIVQLAWGDDADPPAWLPDEPDAGHQPELGEARTNEVGAFAVFLRNPIPGWTNNKLSGRIKVRLQIMRPEPHLQRMTVTPDAWFPGDNGPADPMRIPVGQLFPRDLNLEWQPD